MFSHLFAKILTICIVNPYCNAFESAEPTANTVGCQHKSTHGRDYRGTANTTESGIPCQKWSDTDPIDHQFTHVGDHNYCRNSAGTDDVQVWCLANDTSASFWYVACAVPFCPPLKVLDFSLDNDWNPDANNSYTHASLLKENFSSSFTICTAFMVEQWEALNSPLFLLLDSNNNTWLYVELFAAGSYTEFTVSLPEAGFNIKSPLVFFRLQWSRVCFSFNSNTSMATLVVDGNQLMTRFENEVRSYCKSRTNMKVVKWG